MRAQLENVGQLSLANFRRDDFLPSQSWSSLFLSYCNCLPRLNCVSSCSPLLYFYFIGFLKYFTERRNRTMSPEPWRPSIWQWPKKNLLISSSSWSKLEEGTWPNMVGQHNFFVLGCSDGTDSKSKSTRGINVMTKKGGIRLVYVWAHCDGHVLAKRIEINCLDQRNLTSFQHDVAVDPQWLPATIVGELTVALLSV